MSRVEPSGRHTRPCWPCIAPMHWHGRGLLRCMTLQLGWGVLGWGVWACRRRPPRRLHGLLRLLRWQGLLLHELLLLQCLRPLQEPDPWEWLPRWDMGQHMLLLGVLDVRPVQALRQAWLGLMLNARVEGLQGAGTGLRLRWQGAHACLCCCCMVGMPVQVHCCSVHRLRATKGVRLLASWARCLWLCTAALLVHPAG